MNAEGDGSGGGARAVQNQRFMRMALALGERGRGKTSPNPVVGAVLTKNGKIVARGYHRGAGLPHAEIEALAKAGDKARGSTLYVTLEPCCHTGRTGPCTDPIIKAGVRRVVLGCRDPNPLVDGRGIARLRRARIDVEVGCLEEECRAANRAFFRWIRDGRPWITLKAAATLDGFIAPASPTKRGEIHWITGPEARRAAHELRATHDAILVGAGTIVADDPRLTARLGSNSAKVRATKNPLRVVIDGRLSTPATATLFRTPSGQPPLVIGVRADCQGTTGPRDNAAFARRVGALRRAGGEVELLPGRLGHLRLSQVLAYLAKRGTQSLLVEGGSQVLGEFIAEKLVDEVVLFLAPKLWGAGVPIADGGGRTSLAGLGLRTIGVERLGDDILLRAEVVAPRQKSP